jgi:hypothetical protein
VEGVVQEEAVAEVEEGGRTLEVGIVDGITMVED